METVKIDDTKRYHTGRIRNRMGTFFIQKINIHLYGSNEKAVSIMNDSNKEERGGYSESHDKRKSAFS